MPRERGHLRPGPDRFIVTFHPALPPPAPAAVVQGDRPLEVDLGCGRGRFLLARARAWPQRAFVGVDRMLPRLRKLDRKLADQGLTNVRLIHGESAAAVAEILPRQSVTVFYLLFPDPWPKRKHLRRRLVAAPFVDHVWAALAPGGQIHCATDHLDYFDAIRKLLAADVRFEPVPPFMPTEEERTDFEVLFHQLNRPTHRCSYRKKP